MAKIKSMGSNSFFIKFDRDDMLMETLKDLFEKYNWCSVAIKSAIGMSYETSIGQYSLTQKKYVENFIEEEMEIISLNGNITYNYKGEIVPHVHGVFSKFDESIVGGHVIDLNTRLTIEMFVDVYDVELIRYLDEEQDVNLIDIK